MKNDIILENVLESLKHRLRCFLQIDVDKLDDINKRSGGLYFISFFFSSSSFEYIGDYSLYPIARLSRIGKLRTLRFYSIYSQFRTDISPAAIHT